MFSIGIDPDTNDTAIAWWGDEGPVAARVAHVVRRKGGGSLKDTHAAVRSALDSPTPASRIAIEGQQKDRRKVPMASLFKLAHVTGICIAEACRRYRDADLVVPRPDEWKGQVTKHAHQARMYRDLGWGYEIVGDRRKAGSSYARPKNPPANFSHITPGQWKHVGDALLLARWAHQQD